MKQFHMDSLYMSLSQFLVSNGASEMCEKLLQNKKARVGNGCYMSVSKKPRKQEPMT